MLWVLCMDPVCHEALLQLKLPNMKLISLDEFENGDAALCEAKKNRSTIEYYFTCTPSLPLFILNRSPEIDMITYLDADLFFYGNPSAIFEEMGHHSVAVIKHRFPPHLRDRERHGIYNVGWLSFRNDPNGLSCLKWWRDRCNEWCYDRLENNRYADQKYLDDWPTLFKGVIILRHKGANLAPWNLSNYIIRLHDTVVYVDEDPLIFYHFHGLKKIRSWMYEINMSQHESRPSLVVLRYIYQPYIKSLSTILEGHLSFIRQASLMGQVRSPSNSEDREDESFIQKMKRKTHLIIPTIKTLTKRDCILYLNGRVL